MYEDFKAEIDRQGLAIGTVARMAGIYPKTLYDWRDGITRPKHTTMRSIADALNIPVEILEREDDG